jgi:aspartate-semialdehyde dehydrogenase
VAVIGATGTLGSDVIAVLEERDYPVGELVPVATDASLGEDVTVRGETLPVLAGEVPLRAADVAFLCLPPEAAAPWVKRALEAKVPCIDLSGAMAGVADVPVVAADLAPPRERLLRPLVVSPPGPALAWALALAPLQARFGLARVHGTSLEAASGVGRAGIRTLEAEVVALFNQEEPPESSVFAAPVAFDCVPELEHPEDPFGAGPAEARLVALLQALLGAPVPIAATRVRVPTFSGLGASLAVELGKPADPADVRAALLDAPGLELWDPEAPGPSTRDAGSRTRVLVGRLRRDPTGPAGVLLWLAADPVRLAATNAVRIAEARFELH